MKYLEIFTALVFLFNIIESKKPISSRIVGGSEAVKHQYPWQAFLLITVDTGTFQCSGVLFNSRWILTAAHCVIFSGKTVSSSKITIHLGIHDIDDRSTQSLYSAIKVVSHLDYRQDSSTNVEYYDIALLKLSRNAIMSNKIANAKLSVIEPPSSTICYVSGWGKTGFADSSEVLRKTNVPLISDSKCKSKYKDSWIRGHMLCAGWDNGGKDSCQGDSGGPLQCIVKGSLEVVGIVSWGAGCAEPNKPGVYSSVSHFKIWINDTIHGISSSAGGEKDEGYQSNSILPTTISIALIVGVLGGVIAAVIVVVLVIVIIYKHQYARSRIGPNIIQRQRQQPQRQPPPPQQQQQQYYSGSYPPPSYTNESANFSNTTAYHNNTNFGYTQPHNPNYSQYPQPYQPYGNGVQ